MPDTSDAPPRSARLFAWGGALLFFASLSCFLYVYVVTFGEITPPVRDAAVPAIVDVLLFTAFALHHSVFARPAVRAQVARVVPATLERSAYVWVASVLFLGVCLLWQPVPGVAWQASGMARWILVGLQGAGIALTVSGASRIDVLELSGVRQLSAKSVQVEFTTAGPYGWIRHPIYAGWFLFVFCTPLMTMTRLVFALISSFYLLAAIPLEETTLLATSSGAYQAYTRRVRWKLVPWVY